MSLDREEGGRSSSSFEREFGGEQEREREVKRSSKSFEVVWG